MKAWKSDSQKGKLLKCAARLKSTILELTVSSESLGMMVTLETTRRPIFGDTVRAHCAKATGGK
jgi:hypothetical protein